MRCLWVLGLEGLRWSCDDELIEGIWGWVLDELAALGQAFNMLQIFEIITFYIVDILVQPHLVGLIIRKISSFLILFSIF